MTLGAAHSRPRRSTVALASTAAVGFAALVAWAHFVEPRLITTTSTTLKWPGPSVRIVLLTDIHAGPGEAGRVRQIVRKTEALAPDLVLYGGDFVQGMDANPRKLESLEPLSSLRAPLGVYAVLGNHDSEAGKGDPTRRDAIVRCVQNAGITVLENGHVRLPNGVVLVGIGSWRAGNSDPEAAFRGVDGRAPTLVLVHNFQSLKVPGMGRFDVALAGHTHAGQACVPFTEVCPFLQADMKPYRHGLYAWPSGGWLYVSAGLGTSAVPVRIGARPEIAVITLQGA